MKSLYHRTTNAAREFVTKWHGYLAAGLLAVMFGLGLSSMAGNSAIVDEIAHIPAGYSYLHFGDYRLNPEHPPLIKDLAGLPLQFMDLKFPLEEKLWTEDVNGQWEAGWHFLYHIGNDPDAILFWARLPLLLLAIAFGGFLYWFARRRWGTAVALLALFLYALSPNFLAHSPLVTTDLGASVFMFIAIVVFARFMGNPSGRNLLLLSFALAGAQLAKFSSILLYVFLGMVSVGLVWLMKNKLTIVQRLEMYVGGFISAAAISVVWVYLYYIPHVWNMPVAVQDKLIQGSLPGENVQGWAHLLMSMNDVSVLKPLVQWLLGLVMVYVRVGGGNVTYFNGQVSDQSFHAYFPQLFVMKTNLALLILAVAVAGFLVYRAYKRKPASIWSRLAGHIRTHVLEWTLGGFAAFYFLISVAGNLNLGIRHVLPVYVPLFVITALGLVRWCRMTKSEHWRKLGAMAVAVLLVWYGASTIINHPNYLSYFNEVGGGPKNSNKYFTDSSVDWGQDLKRLKEYVEDHPEINHIAVDYFGGGLPEYYFCQRKFDDRGKLVTTSAGYDCSMSVYEPWHSHYGTYSGQYIAVSETFLMNDKWYAELNGTPGYDYLRAQEPLAKIGNSIYLYKLY